jgi:TolA-binding protein
MGDIKKEYHLKNISGSDAKRILEIADQENIDIEAIIDFIKLKGVKKMSNEKTDDEKRFSKEEVKVDTYMAEHKGVSYREAVLAVLDRTEPEPKKEFTAEEIEKRENLKAIENYISANPRASYKDAVKVVLRGEELTLEEKLIEEYLEKNPGSDYKEAVIESLSLLKKEEKP